MKVRKEEEEDEGEEEEEEEELTCRVLDVVQQVEQAEEQLVPGTHHKQHRLKETHTLIFISGFYMTGFSETCRQLVSQRNWPNFLDKKTGCWRVLWS